MNVHVDSSVVHCLCRVVLSLPHVARHCKLHSSMSRPLAGPGPSSVIPESVSIQGSLRAGNDATFEFLQRRVKELVVATAQAHRCEVSNFKWGRIPYPATVNDPTLAQVAADVATRLASSATAMVPTLRYQPIEAPCMTAEDFSFYRTLANVRCAYVMLGTGGKCGGETPGEHSAQYVFDESQLPVGAALYANLALETLRRLQTTQT